MSFVTYTECMNCGKRFTDDNASQAELRTHEIEHELDNNGATFRVGDQATVTFGKSAQQFTVLARGFEHCEESGWYQILQIQSNVQPLICTVFSDDGDCDVRKGVCLVKWDRLALTNYRFVGSQS